MNAEQSIQVIKAFMISQMDGQLVPPTASDEVAKLGQAIGVIHRSTSADHRMLGLELLDAIIGRVRSSISAEIALQEFITGGRQG